MAGIVGTLDLRPGLDTSTPLVARMAEVILHRGPALAARVDEPPLSLAARAREGESAIGTCGSVTVLLDGDLYDLGVLCRELDLDEATDAPTVVATAWARWGRTALPRLDGPFALAVWDADRRFLVLARDRLGLRPLYFTTASGRLRFASEIKALLADPSVQRAPNDDRVHQFLAYGIADHTGETMFDGIRQLRPGELLEAAADGRVAEADSWCTVTPAPTDHERPDTVIRRLLEDAVLRRVAGAGRVAVTLSGGLDSSTVLALAAERRRAGGEEPPLAVVVRTREGGSDEWPYAAAVADRFAAPVVQVWPDADGLVRELDAFLWHLDEPVHSLSVYGHWKAMEAAREAGADVVLEGQFGDLFGVLAVWYPHFLYELLRTGRLRAVRRELVGRRREQGVPISDSVLDVVKLLLPNAVRMRRDVPRWLAPHVAQPRPPFPPRTFHGRVQWELSNVDVPHTAREVDRNAGSFALVERSPFLDRRVVEYGLSIPLDGVALDGWSKHALREAVRGTLPDTVVDRRDKQGFTVDQPRWFTGSFGEVVAATLGSSRAERPYWDAAALRRAVEAARAGTSGVADVWRAFAVERWLELFADSSSAPLSEPPTA